MAPFKSSDGRSLGKLLEGFKTSTLGQGFGSGGAGAGNLQSIVIPNNIATGGVVEVTGGLIRHVFVSPGTFIAGPQHPGIVSYLVIGGGGGGGGSHHGGGGGAGGVIFDPSHPVTLDQPYSVVVGEGGQGGRGRRDNPITPGVGGQGGYSSIFGATGFGGGGGGSSQTGGNALAGGSGGGAGGSGAPDTPGGSSGNTAGPGTAYGNAGGPKSGNSTTPGYYGGGGGGAGGAGDAGGQWSPQKGNGGVGRDFPSDFFVGDGGTGAPWTGFAPSEPDSRYFAGGGGASGYAAPVGGDGRAGGGKGASAFNSDTQWNNPGTPHAGVGQPGRNFWGSGGGGGERRGGGGGHGGNGVVIIAYDATPTTFCSSRTNAVKLVNATGGFISEHLNPDGVSVDRVHMFSAYQRGDGSDKASQQFVVTSTVGGSVVADILLVGGGGGGGWKGGGGGGGEVVTASTVISNGTYIVKVGCGGAGCMSSSAGTGILPGYYPGDSTTFGPSSAETTWQAGGGGKGGADGTDAQRSGRDGYVGGSGGGVAGGGYATALSGGSVTTNPAPNPGATQYANAGGARSTPYGLDYTGGGGGGAGQAGTDGGSNSGNGGNGVRIALFDMYGTNSSNSVDGSDGKGYFGGGGGGGGDSGAGGAGGYGGGGFGATPSAGWTGAYDPVAAWAPVHRGRSGLNGTGGGGGAGSNDSTVGTGGDGGDGIFCIRYKYIQN